MRKQLVSPPPPPLTLRQKRWQKLRRGQRLPPLRRRLLALQPPLMRRLLALQPPPSSLPQWLPRKRRLVLLQ
jgi:hypothetical protein